MDSIDRSVDDNIADDQLTGHPHDGRRHVYTAEPAATLLDSLKGGELQRYAETVIVNVMLKRADLLEPSAWNGIITKNSSNSMISLQEFLDKWSGRHHPLSDTEIVALLSRFGNPYKDLQISLKLAAESNVNRSYLVSLCYSNYNCKSIKNLCTGMLPSATSLPFSSHIEINQHMLYDFLFSWESIINLIEIQISRSDKDIIQDNLIDEPLKDGTIRTLLKKLGISGVHSYQIKPILNNASLFSGESSQLTLLDLQTYCRARISSSSNNNGILSYMTKDLSSLLEPFSCPLSPLSSSTSSKDLPRNILSLFSTLLPDSSGNVSSHDFSILMEREYPKITKSLSLALIKCVSNATKIDSNDIIIDNYKDDHKISVENFQLFCYPKGFSFSVFMLVGSFKIKNSRIKPTDTIDKLYSLATKQLFFSLRKQRHSDPNLKVPKDLELFLDSNYTKLIPNSNDRTVISFFDNNSKLYGKSDYVNDLFEFEHHLILKKEVIKEKIKSGLIKKEGSIENSFTNTNNLLNAKRKTNKKDVYCFDDKNNGDFFDTNKHNYRNKKLQNNNNDNNNNNNNSSFIDNDGSTNRYCNTEKKVTDMTSSGINRKDTNLKQISGHTVHIPPSPLFLGSVNEAHKWGIPMSIKVSDRIILGDNFLSYVYLIYDFYFLNS